MHGTQFAGEAEADKLRASGRDRQARRRRAGAVGFACGAWTFNIRGADVSHTPLPLSYALVPKDGRPTIFIDHRKLSNSARDHLEQIGDVAEPEALTPELTALAQRGAPIALDSATAADALSRLIASAGGKPVRGSDPVSLLKAVKNTTEIEGTRAAHRRDAVALARFLAWIDREAPSGALTEIDAVEALETFRRDTGALKDVSFPTISGTGPNGAIVHYRVTRKSNRRIAPGDLLLIDSGAQYEDGTTDVTRTIAIGAPTGGNARPLHPRAEGPYRDRARGVSRRHTGASSIRWRGNSFGRPASISSMAPATASAAIFRCTRARRGFRTRHHAAQARHDRLQRARLLQDRRLRHPHREFELVVAADIAGAEKPVNAFETLTLAPIDRA